MNYISLIPYVISFAALGVSLAAYLLSRKLPNENKIFEEKIRCYHILVKGMNDLAGEVIAAIDDYRYERSQDTGDLKAIAEDLDGRIAEAFFQLEDTIAENSLVVPNPILKAVYDFLDLLDQPEYVTAYQQNARRRKLEVALDQTFDRVVMAMQEDLGFEKLDRSLRRRTGGRNLPETEDTD